jgi:beta-glucosidase-like glycosyl hydrolase
LFSLACLHEQDDIDTPQNRQLAFEAGTEAQTLLKNEKPPGAPRPLLPLSTSGTIAVIGPAANFTQELLANYHGWNTVVRATPALLMSVLRFTLRFAAHNLCIHSECVMWLDPGQHTLPVAGSQTATGEPARGF